VARCTGGHPLVIRNAPLDATRSPFPTTYWLTCPDAVRAVSSLESEGWVARLNERYDADPTFRASVDRAHEAYARDRALDHAQALGWGGVGGTRRGLKCLHAHLAHHVAGGDDPAGAWVAERVLPVHPDERTGRVAAIDQGTNSCRLIVVEPASEPGEEPTELARDMLITRLGQGVDATGRLDDAALERTIGVLATYCRRARALGATRIRVAATSAVRDAENREVFTEAVRRHAGTEPEVITGDAEAALSFLGGTRGLDPSDGPFFVFDIGGGSTEFVVGKEPGRADAAVSTRIGSVRLTERLIADDPPSDADLRAVGDEVGRTLDDAFAAVPAHEAHTVVGVAGTATTMQAIALGLDRYDPERIHRTWLSLRDAERIFAELARMPAAERAALPVMAPGRGDVIVAGAAILVAVMRRLAAERMLVSETDILDGLAWEMLEG
jgi:exopolyphosphatase/guanosine-5'-triphosphate,3'-diphosphate pyrophosphatase